MGLSQAVLLSSKIFIQTKKASRKSTSHGFPLQYLVPVAEAELCSFKVKKGSLLSFSNMYILFSCSECVAMANRALFPSPGWGFSALPTALFALVYLICKEIKPDSTGISLFRD